MVDIYNLSRDVNSILNSISELKDVEPNYPDEITVFPMAVYSTVRKTFNRNADNEETDTSWTVTVDVFKQQGSLTAIVDEITVKFANIGFVATVQQANQAGFNRSIITLTGVIDNTSRRVYQAQ
ncbi:hypothetical protein IWT25_02380 [Secundilactobacillus pentosiphilus]|uniref:Prophage protein n=1 Tax=Secundilactobacillus pentosiphilus TaxID=1714682 RepID=A0A1Z5IZM5_9LACO|nr:hypothetical protein [Secundilactobacillus pentosiphilus]GAX07032.1 hypothetical protein IWT25_02380 [Secundilactobacillus pentosiphilus]